MLSLDRRLSDVLSEFARTLGTDFPIQGILDHLVGRIVDVLPVDAAGVTLINEQLEPRYIAASDSSALRFERLQTVLGEGPCIAAYESANAVAVSDLREDLRFPEFSQRAVAEGLLAVFTFPLRHELECLGALDLYRKSEGPLDRGEMTAAQTLADVATAYLLNAWARDELQAASDQAHDRAMHDALTGLPNRSLLLQRLDHAVLRTRRSEKVVGVLYADLDGFKGVNDTYGHATGDLLLAAVARRLTAVVRPGDTVARLAGDEFVVLCEDLDDTDQVAPVVARVTAAMSEPFLLDGVEVRTRASLGVAFAGPEDLRPEQVLEDADAAMYEAKHGDGGGVATGGRRRDGSTKRVNLASDLKGALGRDELYLDYQPIVTTGTGVVIAAEALLRWTHPERGLITPTAVVSLAERSGQINEIGRWVLESACSEAERWRATHPLPAVDVCVNVSVRQLVAPGFPMMLAEILESSRLRPDRLILEMTESVLVTDFEAVLAVLVEVKALGVRLALDDFGSGYSSLVYLNRFPADVLKLDGIFTSQIIGDPAAGVIVGAVISLAHRLDMEVVAEGVETLEQRDRLKELGCDKCQGFFFARPMAVDAVDELLATMSHLP